MRQKLDVWCREDDEQDILFLDSQNVLGQFHVPISKTFVYCK